MDRAVHNSASQFFSLDACKFSLVDIDCPQMASGNILVFGGLISFDPSTGKSHFTIRKIPGLTDLNVSFTVFVHSLPCILRMWTRRNGTQQPARRILCIAGSSGTTKSHLSKLEHLDDFITNHKKLTLQWGREQKIVINGPLDNAQISKSGLLSYHSPHSCALYSWTTKAKPVLGATRQLNTKRLTLGLNLA